jgi:hypothetical protein
MKRSSTAFYLPIRAFGDFIITAAVVKGQFKEKIPVLLPSYFDEIFRAIGADQYFEIAGTVSFSNQPIFFQLYTLTKLENWSRLLGDLATIRTAVNLNDTFLVDYSSRRLLFTGAKLYWPEKQENAYEGKLKMFSGFFENKVGQEVQPILPPRLDKNSRVLILPDSRINVKRIDAKLIDCIREHFSETLFDVASFSNTTLSDGRKSYQSFEQLIGLIKDYDLIIGAESLPYHLANYLRKPHFVIYNQSRHQKDTFMTPFMLDHQAYSQVKGNQPEPVLKQIGQFFY